ncbi:WD40/YVTN/BNR-like repeat-containing protein [Tahibacter sp. UC22_41]|uniref:WD40/YVTN/BNR-like repeat-containing protein n=1 Tax=Tahibacter sp. UC22_41 TaxID=3350178 RepID=UPI0036DBD78C
MTVIPWPASAQSFVPSYAEGDISGRVAHELIALKDASGVVNPDGLRLAGEQRETVLSATRSRLEGGAVNVAGISPSQWTSLGPNNHAGRAKTIAIDPLTRARILVGMTGGGLWVTDDGGKQWRPVNDFLPSLVITSIAFAPSNRLIVYAATGENEFPGQGIYKSTDAGMTWAPLSSTRPLSSTDTWSRVVSIAVHPQNPQIVVALTYGGVRRSADGGATWSAASTITGNSRNVLFSRHDPNRVVTGAAYSTNAGATWTASPSGFGGATVAMAENTSGMFYSISGGYVYRSLDFGQTWQQRTALTGFYEPQWYHNQALWVDPTNAQRVVVGGVHLYRSVDGGTTFTDIHPNAVHVDNHAIVSEPEDGKNLQRATYVGNDGGVYRHPDLANATPPPTQDSRWADLNSGLVTTLFYTANGRDSTLLGGTQDNGTYRYQADGAWNLISGGDGGGVVFDRTSLDVQGRANRIGSVAQYLWPFRVNVATNVIESLCSGLTEGFCANSQNAAFIPELVSNPASDDRVYAGGINLWMTPNFFTAATPSWQKLTGALALGTNMTSIATAASNPNVVWFASQGGYPSDGKPTVYRTTNALSATPTFSRVIFPATIPLWRSAIAIWIDPVDASRVYVGLSSFDGHNLWRTLDGGSSWTSIHANLPKAPVYTVTQHPLNPNRIYAGTEVGLFASEDNGASWSTTSDGPAHTSVRRLVWLNDSTLVAATHGRGMFKVPVSSGLINEIAVVRGPLKSSAVFGQVVSNRYQLKVIDNVQIGISGVPVTLTLATASGSANAQFVAGSTQQVVVNTAVDGTVTVPPFRMNSVQGKVRLTAKAASNPTTLVFEITNISIANLLPLLLDDE